MKQVSKLLSIKVTDTMTVSAAEQLNLKGGQLTTLQIGCPPPIGFSTTDSEMISDK